MAVSAHCVPLTLPYPLTTACSTLSPRPVVQHVYLQSFKAWLSLGRGYLQVYHHVCKLCAQCVVVMLMHGGGMVAITYIFGFVLYPNTWAVASIWGTIFKVCVEVVKEVSVL